MKLGDVVLLRMEFHQTAGGKARPAIVLLDAGDDDFVAAPVTSRPKLSEYDFPVQASHQMICASRLPFEAHGRWHLDNSINELGVFQVRQIFPTAQKLRHIHPLARYEFRWPDDGGQHGDGPSVISVP